MRNEPEGLDITLKNKEVERAFKQVGCWNFCKKLQGGHAQVTKEFSLNFTGLKSKVGMLELQVSPNMISTVTEIPRGQESWFKNFKFDMNPCKEFLKQEFIDSDLNKFVPKSYVKVSYAHLLTCIQKYLTCEGRYNKVYSYHFKLLLHFTGKASIDLPFYLFRSLSKMCDKVQLKKESCDTSLLHHGLVKLIVLHELHKVGRDWHTFLFMSGLKNETGLSPQATKDLPTTTGHQTETRSKRFSKLKARKQVRESIKPLTIQDTPQQYLTEKTRVKERAHESSTGEGVQRRMTRSQVAKEKGKSVTIEETPVSKGDLNDLLKAIDIEESPLEQVELIESGKDKAKRVKASKKLKFDDQVDQFVFKPRRPITRKIKQIQEVLPSADETREVTQPHERKDKGKTVAIQEEDNMENLKKRLELANFEIAKLKKAAKKFAIKEAYFNQMQARWEDQTFQIPEVVDFSVQFRSWTVPAIKEAQFIRKVNTNLRSGIKVMKK